MPGDDARSGLARHGGRVAGGNHPPDPDERNGEWEAHWRRFAESARANPAQAYRRRLVCRLLGSDAARRDAAILDIGCGQGDLLAELARRFPLASLAGIDASRSGLAAARGKLPAALLAERDLVTAGAPPELRGWATHAVCSEVLEHVDDPARLLAAASSSMRPGCRLVITVPGGPMSAFDRHIGHRRHYTKALLKEVAEEAGYEVEMVAGAGFPMFNLYRLVVLLRGERLIGDAGGTPGLLARSAMAVFRRLIPLSLSDSRWGWQIAAAARKKVE